jgi:hypothetical protein
MEGQISQEWRKPVGNYLFVHHFPKNYQGSPETAAAAAAWFEQLWPSLTGRTLPEPEPHQLGDAGADPVPSAFEVVTANGLEGAMALAEAWPLVSRGGRIEVRELTTQRFTPPVASATSAVSNQRQ